MAKAQDSRATVHLYCSKFLSTSWTWRNLHPISFPFPCRRPYPAFPYRLQGQLHSLQCAVLAAAVIGSFSWSGLEEAYWLAPALWHSSLVISILGILLSAQQLTVLDLLGQPQQLVKVEGPVEHLPAARIKIGRFLPLMLTEVVNHREPRGLPSASDVVNRWTPRWKMVFAWQCPAMFMSYATSLYLGGLTVYVCSPLIQGRWDSGSNVSLLNNRLLCLILLFMSKMSTDADHSWRSHLCTWGLAR